MEAMKGLSSETIGDYFTSTRLRLLWDKAQSDYKDHDQKEMTWNNIMKSVELPGFCQIKHTFSESVHL